MVLQDIFNTILNNRLFNNSPDKLLDSSACLNLIIFLHKIPEKYLKY
jgi:hypothetical protein